MNKQEIEKAIETLKCIKNCYSGYPAENALILAISALEQQLNNVWIPVSERLPDVHKRYLVSMKHKSLNDTFIDCRYYDPDYQFEYQDDFERYNWEVIAWQNLPKLYKELATDNNVVTKSGKDNNVLTIGDKIRESNRSLAYMLGSLCSHGATDIKTFEMRGWTTKKWLDYLNQPYME